MWGLKRDLGILVILEFLEFIGRSVGRSARRKKILEFPATDKQSRISVSIFAGFAIVLILAMTIGLVHGLLITKLKLQPFIVTLCGLFIYRGIARYMTGEMNQGFGNSFGNLRQLVKFKVFGFIPMPFMNLIIVGIIAAVFLNRTTYGRYLLALGRNESAARYSGINTDRMVIVAYIICSSNYKILETI